MRVADLRSVFDEGFAGDALSELAGRIGTADELADKIISLLKDPRALREAGAASKAALESLQGATAKTLALIEKYL